MFLSFFHSLHWYNLCFPYLQLDNNCNFCCRHNSCRTDFLYLCSTVDPGPCLCCMSCRPAVICFFLNKFLIGSNHADTHHSSISHSQKLPIWERYTSAPFGPLTFFHDVSSHLRLLHASVMSCSLCPVRTVFAQKHVAARASSCFTSMLLISRTSESETEGFFLQHWPFAYVMLLF